MTEILPPPTCIRAGARNVPCPWGPGCLGAREGAALHAHPTADRPTAPTLQVITHHTRTRALEVVFICAQGSGSELVPQQPPEHSQSTQTDPAKPSNLPVPWPITGTHQAPLRHSRALLLHPPDPAWGAALGFHQQMKPLVLTLQRTQ